MLAGVVDTAPPTAEAYGIAFMSLATVAAVIGVPILVVFLFWRAASQSLRDRKDAQAKAQAAVAAEQAATDAFLKRYSDWTDHSYSLFDKSFVAVDSPGRQVALGAVGNATTYSFDAITAVEVIKDGGVLTVHRDTPTTPLFQQPYFAERALLIAMESPTNTVSTVRELALKVTVNDPDTPVYEISFLHAYAAIGVLVTDDVVVGAVKRLDKFHGLLTNALAARRAPPAASADPADRLKKLWELKQAGAITESEYADQKAKLLSA